MSSIVLSAAVRRNLSALQGTARLLDRTQARLGTGNRVNSALDNPTSFFTARGLKSRAGDISNLLDSVANGVQVLRAADQGLTSMQKLVDTATSIARQARQAQEDYLSPSHVTLTGGVPMATNPNALWTGAFILSNFQVTDSTGTATTIQVGASYSPLSGNFAQVVSLDQLNTVLDALNVSLHAGLDGPGSGLVFTSTDPAQIVDDQTGTPPPGTVYVHAGSNMTKTSQANPVMDPGSYTLRANLADQYNQVMDQLVTTAQDASFNGVNLLNGDDLKLVFNETGSSGLTVAGMGLGLSALGLRKLVPHTDVFTRNLADTLLTNLQGASKTLRAQASAYGANLQVVQIRQDFTKRLIGVLETGASALTIADSNEEAANSQALSTRQSIAISALSLANQSQQGVLRLLQ